jgi:myo-inositol-1(or 4)-monophosphatase
LFHAEKGAGAYLNDHRLRVSSRDKMMESVIATGIPAVGRGRYDEYRAQLALVMEKTVGIRRMGSAALDLAYVAAGRYEGFWEPALSPWDIAAGIVILREAGGYVTDFDGAAVNLDNGDILAANDRMHGPLKSLLAKANTG